MKVPWWIILIIYGFFLFIGLTHPEWQRTVEFQAFQWILCGIVIVVALMMRGKKK